MDICAVNIANAQVAKTAIKKDHIIIEIDKRPRNDISNLFYFIWLTTKKNGNKFLFNSLII